MEGKPGHIARYLSKYITMPYLARVHADFFPAWRQHAGAWSGRAVGDRPQAAECSLFRCEERAWPLEM